MVPTLINTPRIKIISLLSYTIFSIFIGTFFNAEPMNRKYRKIPEIHVFEIESRIQDTSTLLRAVTKIDVTIFCLLINALFNNSIDIYQG